MEINLYFIFTRIFQMGITGSIMIAAVLLLRVLLCKAPRRYAYMLWGIVLFRLLCPISWPSVFSVLNLVETPVLENRQADDRFPEERMGENNSPEKIVLQKENMTKKAESYSVQKFRLDVTFILPVIWLAGVFILTCYGIFSALKLRWSIRCCMRLRDNIYVADYIATPFVFGLFHPRIYLPSSLRQEEWEYIILHEQRHIARKDYLIKILSFFALCLHWVHPLVWLAFVLSVKDMEMSCDEAVMGKMNRDIREEYANSLLQLAVGKSRIFGLPLAFTEGDVKSRIKHIMNYKKQTASASILAAVVCVIGLISLATNPMAEQEPSMKEDKAVSETQKKEAGFGINAETVIENAIMEQNDSVYAYSDEYDFACCNFVNLETVSDGFIAGSGEEIITYYGWAYYGEYQLSQDGIVEVGASHLPVAVSLIKEKHGYRLKEYWEPRDGSYFVEDVKKKFPASAAKDGIDSQKFILQQIQDCYAKAVTFGKLDTYKILKRLLDEICTGPMYSSNPYDYIRAHDREYQELGYYGSNTLEYCMQRFQDGDEEEKTGLKGHIMAQICEDILGIKGKTPVSAESASTGLEWYEAFDAYIANKINSESY